MKRKKITKEEYQKALIILEQITNEKILLKKLNQTSHYQAHIQLSETLEELLLTLKKANEAIDSQLIYEKKKILQSFQFSKITYQQKEEELNNYLLQLLTSNNPSKQGPTFLLDKNNLMELIHQKKANTYLQDQILFLLSQEKYYLKLKKQYKKQQAKKKYLILQKNIKKT